MSFGIQSFPGQHKNEKILLVLRRHWLILARFIIISGLLSLIPIIIFAFLRQFTPNILTSDLVPIGVLLLSGYYLWMLIYFYIGWINFYLDVWIVTTERIINIEQEGLFRRTVAEQNIYRVQDVTAEVQGIIQTFFDYGTVLVQTAGTKDRFTFEQVPHPYKVKKIIIALNEHKLDEEPYKTAAKEEG